MSARLGYVPALDGLRGVAIALVLAFHLGWLSGGFLGVDVFFVLSGFLITTLLLEEIAATGRIGLGTFYARRARRLLPALIALLVIFVVAAVSSGRYVYLGYVAAVLLYVANIVRVLGHEFPPPLRQMWSLGQEEQFYLLWPVLLSLGLRRLSLKRIAVALAVVLVLGATWRSYLTLTNGATARVLLGPDTHADPLLVGCLLAIGRISGLRAGKWMRAAGWPAMVFVLVASLIGNGRLELFALIPACAFATAAVLAVAVEPNTLLARLLSLRPFVWLGKISYSVYIWHLLVFVIIPSSLVRLPLALAVGAASYRWIEQPFRRRRARPEPDLRPSAAVAARAS